jgi:hypothetical protein
MDECCSIRLNVGGNLRNFSVFMQAEFYLWLDLPIKKHWKYNNENLMEFLYRLIYGFHTAHL